jgi:hypothetical protein
MEQDFHYRVQKTQLPAPNLIQINTVKAIPTDLLCYILMLSSHLRAGLQSGLLRSDFPANDLSPYVPHALFITSNLFLNWYELLVIYK